MRVLELQTILELRAPLALHIATAFLLGGVLIEYSPLSLKDRHMALVMHIVLGVAASLVGLNRLPDDARLSGGGGTNRPLSPGGTKRPLPLRPLSECARPRTHPARRATDCL